MLSVLDIFFLTSTLFLICFAPLLFIHLFVIALFLSVCPTTSVRGAVPVANGCSVADRPPTRATATHIRLVIWFYRGKHRSRQSVSVYRAAILLHCQQRLTVGANLYV